MKTENVCVCPRKLGPISQSDAIFVRVLDMNAMKLCARTHMISH